MFMKLGSKVTIAVTDVAAAASAPGDSGRFLLSGNTDMYIRFDAGTATSANYDLFLPSGGMVLIEGVAQAANAFNAIQASANGVLSIHEVK